MATFRIEKSRDYTVMSNYHLRDSSLSLKAKGLLSQMLSLPEGWDYTLAGLAQINKESKDAIRSAVNELEAAGYVQRRQTMDKNGKFAGNEYVIHEQPVFDSPLLDFPTTDNPSTEKPSTENTLTENPTELNKDISSKDISKKKSKKEKADFEPVSCFAKWVNETFLEETGKPDLNQAFARFCEQRQAMKKPVKTQATVTALTNKLEKYGGGSIRTMIDMLDTATASGWQSVYPPKDGAARAAPKKQSGREQEWL